MKFELKKTGERRPSAVNVCYDIKKNDAPKPVGDEFFQEGYTLTATVGVSFFSNTAQLPHKRRQAEQNVISFIYRDALFLVNELLLVAENREAQEIALRLKDIMTRNSPTNER